jgi:hypothetical protein
MSGSLQELEARLAEAFDASDWTIDAAAVAPEARQDGTDEDLVRQINMDLVTLGGSRPDGN